MMAKQEVIDIWVTAHALTMGIRKMRGFVSPRSNDLSGESAYCYSSRGLNGVEYFYGRDWHLTEEAALIRFEVMRVAAIKSLQKRLANLAVLKPKITEQKGRD